MYEGPSKIPWSVPEIQPVPCGLTADVQTPGASEGAVGGNGNSLIITGSGFGAGGLLRISGEELLAQSLA
jgi:hypothetical protein